MWLFWLLSFLEISGKLKALWECDSWPQNCSLIKEKSKQYKQSNYRVK